MSLCNAPASRLLLMPCSTWFDLLSAATCTGTAAPNCLHRAPKQCCNYKGERARARHLTFTTGNPQQPVAAIQQPGLFERAQGTLSTLRAAWHTARLYFLPVASLGRPQRHLPAMPGSASAQAGRLLELRHKAQLKALLSPGRVPSDFWVVQLKTSNSYV